jgi:2,5-diketo-D-gluconate reductase A
MPPHEGPIPALALSLGGSIPVLGFGTWQMQGTRCYDAVRSALDVGYRHIDTATMYENEAEVGRAIHDSGVPRDELFITTKLHPTHAKRAKQVMAESLSSLRTDHVDLWLIHWPPSDDLSVPTWRQLLETREAGFATAVGVSNYSPDQLDELIEATGVAPAVNQIPWSPRQHDERQLAHARARGIVIEGYSPLKGSDLADPILVEIAEAHRVTTPQVIFRWHVQRDVVVIPKSAHRDRIASNFDIWNFTLDDDELARIDALALRH